MTGWRLAAAGVVLAAACSSSSSVSGPGGGRGGSGGGATAGRGGVGGESGGGSGGGTGGGGTGGGAAGTGGAAGSTSGGGSGGASALPINIAFITSTRVTADFGGVAGGDTICQTHAQNAGLPGTYRAWLASSAGSAPSRLGTARGWRRVDGLPIADTVASLVGDPRLFYLFVNERGLRPNINDIWTGTRPDGSASPDTCSDWTSQTGWGSTGNGYLASAGWTAERRVECALAESLYCFGVDHSNPVVAPARPNPSRIVFTSKPFSLTSAGIAAADAFCTAEAAGAGLPGMYRALLSPNSGEANARFEPTAGGPWVRVDGVVPSTTPLASTTQSLRAALNVTSDGSYLTAGSVWTGSLTPVDSGSATLNCNGFGSTSAAGSSVYGTAHHGAEWWSPTPSATLPCNAMGVRLYCLQL
jgi:hypothetical protein